ncbi:MAG TPA: hypothetical protein VNL17_08320 [Verrucomicrobiae bacterium]|nr:hypothetical protein [Verrucomicrobiae bacterium]
MKRLQIIVACTLALAMLGLAGCSKPAAEDAPPPKAVTTKKIEFPAPTNLPSAQPAGSVTTTAPSAAVVPQEDSPAEAAAELKQYEADYQNTSDFQKRVVIIYNLSSVESPDTVDTIGRLFLNEKDKELKVELVNSLLDIEGQNEKKLAILSTAVRGDQPKDVRLQGIDAMGDTEDKRAIQILQGMLTDPDQDIIDAAKDTIDQLQSDVAQPQAPAQIQAQPVPQTQPMK